MIERVGCEREKRGKRGKLGDRDGTLVGQLT